MFQLRSFLGEWGRAESGQEDLKEGPDSDRLLSTPPSRPWLTSTSPSLWSSWTPQAASTFVLMLLPPLITRYPWFPTARLPRCPSQASVFSASTSTQKLLSRELRAGMSLGLSPQMMRGEYSGGSLTTESLCLRCSTRHGCLWGCWTAKLTMDSSCC